MCASATSGDRKAARIAASFPRMCTAIISPFALRNSAPSLGSDFVDRGMSASGRLGLCRADALSTYMTGYQRSPDCVVGLGPTCKAGDLAVLNDDDVIDLLKAAVKREGGQSAFAKRHGVNRTELNSILNGRRRISASLAKALGLRRVYVVEEEAKKHSERLSSLAASSAGVVGRHQGREDFPGPLVVEADTTT
jgi:hypothetical protein